MIFQVVVDISTAQVDKTFDYLGDDKLMVGQRVLVNFAGRLSESFIVGKSDKTEIDISKLKSIIRPIDDYCAVSEEMLSLCDFMTNKWHLRKIDVLRLFVPGEMRGGKIKQKSIGIAKLSNEKSLEDIINSLRPNAIQQRALVSFLSSHPNTSCEQLNAEYKGALRQLVDKSLVTISHIVVNRTPYSTTLNDEVRHNLTVDQVNCVKEITSDLKGRFLIHGVTGSGKTEVYMTVIEQVVQSGKTCIMLVPEISLTPKMLKLFRSRFGDTVAILHSGLSAGERYDEWQRIKTGEARIVIGARSAVFAPLTNVGAIIIDEEHDSSYVSDSNPRYDTIEVAKFRQSYNNAVLVLGSATPSLETYYKALRGEYKLLTLSTRINCLPLPEVTIVDMNNETRNGNKSLYSATLLKELEDTIMAGNQAILFLNRRGFSSFVMCNKCGYVAKCEDCDVSLVYHSDDNTLKCHYCGKKYKMLGRCPVCKNEFLRQGKIGTQQVVDYLNKVFPDVKILRMDADTTHNKEGHGKILEAFARREAQILVGTQMIAKGHDFPLVTLVGILDADQSLYYSDYAGAEKTFELLTQVAGRSGRDTQSGKVVLQTHTPTHYCLQLAAKQDYLSFYKKEINLREASKFPPFAIITRILYSGEDSDKCIALINKHYSAIEEIRSANADKFIFLQRMRCPIKRVEKKFRFQILMRLTTDSDDILHQIYKVTDILDKDVSVFVEINPQNLS